MVLHILHQNHINIFGLVLLIVKVQFNISGSNFYTIRENEYIMPYEQKQT